MLLLITAFVVFTAANEYWKTTECFFDSIDITYYYPSLVFKTIECITRALTLIRIKTCSIENCDGHLPNAQ